MEKDFWNARWQEGRIGFHEGRPNAHLVNHAARLGEKRRVFVPLCGKSEDLAYLASLGHEVVGVELVESAVQAFFEEHGLRPEVEKRKDSTIYRSGPFTIHSGDLFALDTSELGPLDALYDRAALIALPEEMRARYAGHLRRVLSAGAEGLVVTLEYSQEKMEGPPFSVTPDEVRRLYAGLELERIDTVDATNERMKALGVEAREQVFVVRFS